MAAVKKSSVSKANSRTSKDGASKTKNNKTRQQNKIAGLKCEIISIILFVLAVFIYVSITRSRGVPEDMQFIGWIGSSVAQFLQLLFGEASLLVVFYLLAWSIHLGVIKELWSVRMWGVSMLAFSLLIAVGVYDIPGGLNPFEAGQKGMGGGYIGGALALLSFKMVGKAGTVIFLTVAVVVSLLMIINQPVKDIRLFLNKIIDKVWTTLSELFFYEVEEDNNQQMTKNDPVIINHNEADPMERLEELNPEIARPHLQVLTKDKPVIEEESKTVLPREGEEKKETEIKSKVLQQSYQIPPLTMLSEVSQERSIDKKNIKASISLLEDTFSNFGISVKVNQVSCGPAVTRYEVTPAPGVKVSKIISLADDLQLSLAAPGIRIEAPIPGKSAVGIEVPNSKILSVGLRNLLSSAQFKKINTPLAFALGEDIAGNTVVARLNDMPHLLIAGSTGSGKSVCLNSIIMSFLYNAAPEELRLVFIDPKMVELTVYNGIPHLLTPVITDPKKASVVLKWMVNEMEKRYRLFAERGVRDISRYNQVVEEKLPFIVIVIDELADLMMVSPVEVEDAICRLAQMARAAGMHMIVATQRPSVDVVTGVIKANIPSRIAFAVSSQADSRTILDSGGAEKLLGKGDMLFFPVGAVKPVRIQGAYVSDKDIEMTVDFIKQQAMDKEESEQERDLELSLEQAENQEDIGDELFWDAVDLFVDSGKASVSLLQRRLRIGYARAARLVDLMEERGIVSELDNNKKREILIDSEQLEKLYARQKLC